MSRRFHDQLILDLAPAKRRLLPEPAPAELLTALADLLLEALGKQNNEMVVKREACDAPQDHP
jgi:hypothetical protein